MKNPITKIELDLGGKKVTLTPEQAKNLKNALNELFTKEVIGKKEYVPYPYEPIRPYYWVWQYPHYYTSDRITYCSNIARH